MVIWTQPAKADLRAVHDYIARDSRYYARKVAQEIRQRTAALDRLPRIGRVVPEVGDENVREVVVYSYRILYEIRSDDVFVLALVHKRQDFRGSDLVTGG